MGLKHHPRVVTDGLVMYLDAANTRSYSGSGNTANGLIGGIGGTLVNGVGFGSTNNGSFIFDGTNDYIDCGNFLDNPTDFTVSAWQKTTLSTLQMIVAKLGSYGSGAGWGLHTRSVLGLSLIIQTDGSNWRTYHTSKITSDGIWHHVAATIVNKVPSAFYVDGVVYSFTTQSGGTISSISNAVNVRVGRDEINEYIFQGNISQVQIYNRALTAQEILQNYNATKMRYL
jgi:hypothetical protein